MPTKEQAVKLFEIERLNKLVFNDDWMPAKAYPHVQYRCDKEAGWTPSGIAYDWDITNEESARDLKESIEKMRMAMLDVNGGTIDVLIHKDCEISSFQYDVHWLGADVRCPNRIPSVVLYYGYDGESYLGIKCDAENPAMIRIRVNLENYQEVMN